MLWKVPHQARRGAACSEVKPSASCSDTADAALHLERGPTRKGEEQQAPRVGAGEHQRGDARRQGRGLAGAGAGDDEQRPGRGALVDAEKGRPTLLAVEPGEERAGARSRRKAADEEGSEVGHGEIG